jgi:NTP pyrophosphatase (non-canonical NTP hydrolase)
MSKSISQQAVEAFGEEYQASIVQGECGELIAALTRYFTQDRGDLSEIIEETADVEIGIDQLRYIVGDDLVDEAKAKKLERLQRRINARNINPPF